MTDITVAMLLTVASASLVVAAIVQIVTTALAWDSTTQGRFTPLLAVAVGMVLVTAAAFVSGADVAQGLLTGFVAGFVSMGVHGVVTAATGKATG
jgi:hypothetical protein